MTIYDATYCIHADAVNGRVSLRNISQPSHGTPEHDIVIDVAGNGTRTGPLCLSKVDNLLIVHDLERATAVVFDIRHREKSIVPPIGGPISIDRIGAGPDFWMQSQFIGGATLLD